MSWNNGYPPPSGSPMGFPSPQYHGAPPPPPPNGGYGFPAGPPPGQGYGYNPATPSGYAPPSGPPPPNAATRPGFNSGSSDRGYPGQSYHQGYQSPSGPPPNAGGQWGGYQSPPAQQWNQNPQGHGGRGPVAPGGYYHEPYPPPAGPPHMPPSGVQHYGPHFQQNNRDAQPYFQYSQCTGRKKALCIGINYVGQSAELRGCINDARNVQNFLCQQFGYKSGDIVMLTDDASNPAQLPTKANIMRAMEWLVKGAQPNDSLFFHYSGHGGQTKDLDGDEEDGFDEVIYPSDFETAGHIVDDDMHFTMVKPLPTGCRLTAIFDSCHSGSALDLPYIYSTEGKVKEPNLLAEAGQGLLSSGMSYMRGDMGGVLKGLTGVVKNAMGSNSKAQKYARETRTSSADVISWSGCKDSQTSADTVEAGQATGAMSFAFIDALRSNQQQTYQQLLNNVRETLRNKYSQKPQLSSSHPMDTNILFIC